MMIVFAGNWISKMILFRKYSCKCSKIMDGKTGDISSLVIVRNSVPLTQNKIGERVVNVIANGKWVKDLEGRNSTVAHLNVICHNLLGR